MGQTHITGSHMASWMLEAESIVGPGELSKAKEQLLDLLGILLATKRMRQWDAFKPAVAPATPEFLSFEIAARAHCLDYDDTYQAAQIHPSGVIWASLLTSQEKDGARLLRLYAAAAELFCRMAASVVPQRTWFLTQMLGGIIAAVAHSVANRMPLESITHAAGLAFMQASGTKQPALRSGSTARAMYPGFAAHAGVYAAKLAAGGMQGPTSWADGPAGLGIAYLGDSQFAGEFEAALSSREYQLLPEIYSKPWPSCSLSHPYIAMIQELRTRLGDLSHAELTLHVVDEDQTLVAPLIEKQNPITVQDARYSIPFVAGMAIAGDPSLAGWSSRILEDLKIREVVGRVAVEPALSRAVEVRINERRTILTETDRTLPVWDDARRMSKLLECLDYAGIDREFGGVVEAEICAFENKPDIDECAMLGELYQVLGVSRGTSLAHTRVDGAA